MHLVTSEGGPSPQDRELIYARARMNDAAIQNAEQLLHSSPSRDVGKGALTNVVTLFDSKRNAGQRLTESHTCELIYAYELELDPEVVGYHTQVHCRPIERITRDGHRHVTAANLDFMVFRRNTVQLVECKPLQWLRRQIAKGETDWSQKNGDWFHDPYESYARRNQLDFKVWAGPELLGIYLQNLEASYAVLHDPDNGPIERVARQALEIIQQNPSSVEKLCQLVKGFSGRTALWLLATRAAYGPWRSTPMLPLDRFVLYARPEQAAVAEQCALDRTLQLMGQPNVVDPVLRASATDIDRGRQRLANAEAAMRGECDPPRRTKDLIREIRKAIAEDRDPLSVCITNFANSGNRLSRLLPQQQLAMDDVIARCWNSGRVTEEKDLYHCYVDKCHSIGVDASGKTSLLRRLHQENPARHALSTGGVRSFHAERPSIDTRVRSLSPIGYGHTLHIDSSKFDNRTAPSLVNQIPALAGTFYVGVDSSSKEVMADSFIFGPARTDGLAILIRNYVRRHGRLPKIVHVDRGPENKSLWLKTFARNCFSVRWSPSGGSQWNGLAESVIKRVNDQVAHKLIGSTAPDQAGRKVDGRFKSYDNAKTNFETIRQEIDTYLYQDYPETPGVDGSNPLERRDYLIATFGNMGTSCDLDDSFLIKTSIPIDIKGQFDKRKGVRTEDGFFTSEELIDTLRGHVPEDARRDCEDPTILWVRIGGRWLKAFHSRAQTIALLSPREKLFDLMYSHICRAHGRQGREAIAHRRFTRIELANHATVERNELAERSSVDEPMEVASRASEAQAQYERDRRRMVWEGLPPYTAEE